MSEEITINTKTIYIYLLEEGTNVWRPTQGVEIENRIFEVAATNTYDSDDEKWQFAPGARVECEERVLGGQRVLVAVREVKR